MELAGESFQETFNLGGPDRLSRADMAATVARVMGHSVELVNRVASATVCCLCDAKKWLFVSLLMLVFGWGRSIEELRVPRTSPWIFPSSLIGLTLR